MTRRFFRAELTDRDGEAHAYDFAALTLWAVATHVAVRMGLDGDFYGHKPEATIGLAVSELAAAPPGHLIEIEGNK